MRFSSDYTAARNVGRHLDGQFQSAVVAVAANSEGRHPSARAPERPVLDLDPAGIQGGEVQDVVDQCQQQVPAALGGADVLLLLFDPVRCPSAARSRPAPR